MDAEGYTSVLEVGLKPFISGRCGVVCYMEDNDPNIHLDLQKSGWKGKGFTGGRPLLNLRI